MECADFVTVRTKIELLRFDVIHKAGTEIYRIVGRSVESWESMS